MNGHLSVNNGMRELFRGLMCKTACVGNFYPTADGHKGKRPVR